MNKLHIISFDVPYPANYGGVIDIFYRIKSLHKAGIKITLHTYQYGRAKANILEQYCEKVYYYKRRAFKNPLGGKIPYIVSTRNTLEILVNLKKDDSPIFFEGLHCTFYLNHKDLKHRKKIVRMHNIEHHYYKQLEKVEDNFFKKYFFRLESERLKKYESILNHADFVLTISENDTQYINKKIGNAIYFPAFHPNEYVASKVGSGNFILYHGNLAVGENNYAAIWLIQHIFSKTNVPCIIAGNAPRPELKKAASHHSNIQIKDDLNSDALLDLIGKAHINLLVTFQATGIKLKLLNALYRGRYCITNTPMIEKTGLENLCLNADSPKAIIKLIQEKIPQNFQNKDIELRNEILISKFSNDKNLKILLSLLKSSKAEA